MLKGSGVLLLPSAFCLLPWRISLRRELRYALLAAMETCWVYAVIAFLGALTHAPTVSPLSLFAAYWIALLAGRVLPRLAQSWTALRWIALGIALVTLLVVVRVDVFGARVSWLDMTWLPRYALSFLSLHEAVPGEFLTTIAVLYMFIRGLGYAQRPLTLWFIGLQFRLGIVAFFLVLLASAMFTRYDATLAIFLYFFLGLMAVALARMDEIGNTISLGPRWAVTLIAAVVVVILLGLVLVQFFTLDAANYLLLLLAPVFTILGTLVFLLLIPAGILAEWLLILLEPLVRAFQTFSEAIKNLAPKELTQELQRAPQQNPNLDLISSILRTVFIVLVIVAVGTLLAKALNRRMLQTEQETYVRESAGPEEESGRMRESGRRKRTVRRRAGNVTAETIRRIYAALVARASDAGLSRRRAETPYEFLPRLENAWPEQAGDLQEITEAYIAVHYGEHTASEAEVGKVRAAWRRVQTGIKR